MHDKTPLNFGRLKGLLLMAASGFYITMANCLVRFVYKTSHTSISPYIFLFYRSIIIFAFNSVFMAAGRVHPFGKWRNIFILSSMGVAGTGQILFVFLALERVPVGDATVIQFTAPVFTMALSFVLLGVSCSLFETVCGCISFIGVIIITKPGLFFSNMTKKNYPTNLNVDEQDHLLGIGFALLSAITAAIFYVLNKILGMKFDLTITVFYPSLSGIVVAPVVALALKEPMSIGWTWPSVTVIFLVGLLAFVHLLLLAESLQLEDAGPASLVRNADIVYAFIMQYLFLGVKPTWTTILGASLIITTTTLIAVKRIFHSKPDAIDDAVLTGTKLGGADPELEGKKTG